MILLLVICILYALGVGLTALHVIREGGELKEAAYFALPWPFWMAIVLCLLIAAGGLRLWFRLTEGHRT